MGRRRSAEPIIRNGKRAYTLYSDEVISYAFDNWLDKTGINPSELWQKLQCGILGVKSEHDLIMESVDKQIEILKSEKLSQTKQVSDINLENALRRKKMLDDECERKKIEDEMMSGLVIPDVEDKPVESPKVTKAKQEAYDKYWEAEKKYMANSYPETIQSNMERQIWKTWNNVMVKMIEDVWEYPDWYGKILSGVSFLDLDNDRGLWFDTMYHKMIGYMNRNYGISVNEYTYTESWFKDYIDTLLLRRITKPEMYNLPEYRGA